jgi:uncharacterized membrane protein YbhN (UPF0104 family)
MIDGNNASGANNASSATGVLRNVFALAIIGFFVGYLWQNRTLFRAALDISPLEVAAIACAIGLTWVVASAQSYLMLKTQNVGIGFWENTTLLVAGVLANYLPFRVGTLIRLRYLKRVHGFGYSRSVGLIGIRLFIVSLATGLLGLAGVVWIWLARGVLSLELLATFSGLVTLAIGASLGSLPMFDRDAEWARAWNEMAHGIEAVRAQPWVTLQVLGLILVQLLLVAWRFGFALDAVGMEVSAPLLLVLAPAIMLASFLSLVPGGLGFREAVIGYVTLAAGHDFNGGFFAGTVDRAVMLAMILVVGSLSLLVIYNRREEDDGGLAGG